MTRRPRIAYVITQLLQGGAERYLAELLLLADQDRFELTVLTRPAAAGDFYYPRLVEAGIRFRFDLPDSTPTDPAAITGLARVLADYDLVSVIQIETYRLVQAAADHRRLVIHLMSTVAQYYPKDPYICLLPEQDYILVAGNPMQLDEIRHPRRSSFRWFHMPLMLAFPTPPIFDPPPAGTPIRLAIATRLSLEKPLEPFLIAFHCLLTRHPEAELLIYGGGDPALYGRLIRLLGLDHRIRFRGHQPDLEGAIRADGVQIVLAECFGEGVGYGPLQIAGAGIPVAFWDTAGPQNPEHRPSGGAGIPRFSDIPAYVAALEGWLDDPAALDRYRRRLADLIRAAHGHPGRIRALEDFYDRVIAEAPAARGDGAVPAWPVIDRLDALAALREPFILYGTGAGGDRIFRAARERGLAVRAFARTEGEGIHQDLPVIPLAQLGERVGRDVPIVIASEFYLAIGQSLAAAGFGRIHNAFPLIQSLAQADKALSAG